MEGKYYFGDELRWNLGWDSPNHAGAFLATLIPVAWIAFDCVYRRMRNRRTGWVAGLVLASILIGEGTLWYLVCKTFSRGALVAVLGAAAFRLVIQFWTQPERLRWLAISEFGIRGMVVAILVWWTGFAGRILPDFILKDDSVGNRVSLWRGGLQMAAVAPFDGWGKGESGRQFSHWYQDVNADERYLGMVNSYLHVAVEWGYLTLVVGLAGILFLISLALVLGSEKAEPVKPTRSLDSLVKASGPPVESPGWNAKMASVIGAACGLVAFLGVNVFSTLWIVGPLWVLPGIFAMFLVFQLFRLSLLRARKALRISLLAGVGTAAFTCLGMFLFGLVGNEALRIQRSCEGFLVIQNSGRTDLLREFVFFPDGLVLGDVYGKEIRRFLLDERFQDAAIHVPLAIEEDSFGALLTSFDEKLVDRAVVCGRFCGRDLSLVRTRRILLLHPVGPPDPKSWESVSPTMEVDVLLPEIDVAGHNGRWIEFAKKMGWSLSYTRGVAQDVRAVWPDCLASWDSSDGNSVR